MYDLNQNKPLYIQLYDAIKHDIVTHQLEKGTKLSSVRKMAVQYAISKNSVSLAYQQLYSEGYIESVPKSGYFVADIVHELTPTARSSPMQETPSEPSIRYDFFPARLSPDTFPLKLWQRLFIKAMKTPLDFGAYTNRQGEEGLRSEIARYLMHSRGVLCDASQIILCAGSSDAMRQIATLFQTHFHEIAVEHPGYPAAGTIFKQYGYAIAPIEVNASGLNIDALEQTTAKMVYITPSHQYPTGVSMPITHRMRLLHWAKREGGVIIEDDYDSELRYQNRPIPALQGLENGANVIYMGTFSKALSPALRVSYIVLPHRYLEAYTTMCQMSHQRCGVALSTQKTLELFMAEGHWERHLRKIRTLNRKKHDLMRNKLKSMLGDQIEIISEGGGLAIIMRPTVAIDLHRLRENALKKGMKLYCASDLYGETWEAIRMGFGGLREEEISDAIELLNTIWIETLAR
ncbi:PLP-dependent aminotransferase family protein [Sulfurospirillum cavolei]|uniref:MocR-like pyridoxine biosynthesis transcription factor PdxR n=1 Tax=Sulfurospirillum cavolei TaxID=366522 RepID=UPI000764A673|nr:PLP-dependent aminotransferase family protein [Sulfurospirillum cavolei]